MEIILGVEREPINLEETSNILVFFGQCLILLLVENGERRSKPVKNRQFCAVLDGSKDWKSDFSFRVLESDDSWSVEDLYFGHA